MLRVTSEVGRLRRALVHEPGPEIDRMVPAMMEQLLFDDILFGDGARAEFARLRRVLQLLGVEVLDAQDLLEEALVEGDARAWLVDGVLGDLPATLRDDLREREAAELAAVLVGGMPRAPGQPGRDADDLFVVPPIPNWCFQRDPQVVLGDAVVICSMATAARHREAQLARAVFTYHPDLGTTPVLHDPRDEPGVPRGPEAPHLEGGDVLVLSPDVVAVGWSERTNRAGIDSLARALAARPEGPRWLEVLEIPRRRAYMHLDTLLTPIDRDLCLVHAPVILAGGSEQAQVLEIDLRATDLAPRPASPLLEQLARRGVELAPVRCGGSDPVAQQREQWTDGANAMALAPGVILTYDRNVATIDELDRVGFRVVRAEDLLLGREEIDLDDAGRVCILVSSHEMSRARGGPHCLIHPLERD
jgi:arginine deiminase